MTARQRTDPGRVNAIGVIPARHASTRFPGKPLVELLGKPMIQWVHERAVMASRLRGVLVATDDERIRERVARFGGHAVLTSPDHPSGTDRVLEAVTDVDADVVVNIQGDEPGVEPEAIDAAVEALEADPGAHLATIATPIRSSAELIDPSVVKVVTDARGRALYFSRAPIPWDRDAPPPGGRVPEGALRHVGVYAYRREALDRLHALPVSPLERCEKLEQLRGLQDGMGIAVRLRPTCGPAVDSPDDLPIAESYLATLAATSCATDATPPNPGDT